MVFESLVAASIYIGAITYLHHDSPQKTTAVLETQPQVHTTVINSYEQKNSRSFLANSSTQNDDVDPADLKGESIWAKDEGKFDDWAK